MIVAFQGELGAFGEEAALRSGAGVSVLPCRTFEAVVEAVLDGRADQGVLPISNSTMGDVVEGATAARSPGITAAGSITIPVNHCLLAPSGETIESIARVRSHPAALAQCRGFFGAYPDMAAVTWYDTAGAARDLAAEPEAGTAAIASQPAAQRYGLTVLLENIQDRADNETKFLVLRRG